MAGQVQSWVQRFDRGSLGDDDLKPYLREIDALIFANLPKKARAALGVEAPR